MPPEIPLKLGHDKTIRTKQRGLKLHIHPLPPPPFCSFPIFSALMMKHAQPWSPASPSAQSWLLSRPWRQSSGEDATPLSNVNKTPSVTSQRHLVASSSQIRKYSRSAVELAEPGAQPHELGEATPHVRRA